MDTQKTFQPAGWQRLVHRIASTPLGVRLFAATLHHLDRLVLWLSSGRTSMAGLLAGLPIITLTTTGAKSGLRRAVPLVGLPNGPSIVLIASNWGQTKYPAWYLNLQATPRAEVTLLGRTRPYLAREATPDEYTQYWAQAVNLYAGYAVYLKTAGKRPIPIMVLTPAD